MTTTTSTDSLAFGDLVSHGVLHRRHLRVAGISDRRAAQLSGPGGPWRQVYSGVYLVHDKPPSREELLHAAVARFGPGTIITGTDALCAHGISHPRTPEIHLLVPHNRRPSNEPSIITYRTARMPKAILIDGLPYASAARAALDLARREHDPDEIARLVSLPLYWGLADRAELTTVLNTGNQRGTAAVRTVLRNLDDQETFAHGQALRVLQRTPLPTPQWNVAVCDRRGRRLGTADAWWDEIGLAWRYRTAAGPEDFSHLALAATGTVLFRCTPLQLRESPEEMSAELLNAYRHAARTPRPKVLAVYKTGNAA
ncbi:hypothetical protein CU254_04785 [Amycolatopsis sp. AA4]|uniref:hypothetical protein n=1 Tax=Actinomycetes TaxID=1760 RepID=UPI0001DEDF9A|nr:MULTISPECIES: hypothetical protein [Actinomycetes]ATY09853.1 hypothetical protein CU254_04785 [Amycolatopsis sp. AA4]EFL05259.1 predicted protein [Streptomyces sp. AA4]